MDYLLSGFIGALIATILTVVYLYIADKVRLRTEITLEVVAYCDDIYDRLQVMHSLKDITYVQNDNLITTDEYQSNSRELNTLLKSTKTLAKLEITYTYGEGDVVQNLKTISQLFMDAISLLRKATQNDWSEKSYQIFQLFEQKIDPLRTKIHREMIQSTRISVIMSDLFKLINRNIINLINRDNRRKT